MPLKADISPLPTLLRIVSHSSALLSEINLESEPTERLSPRKVPKSPSVTNRETAFPRNLSHSSAPPSLVPTASSIIAGVLVSLP